MKKNSTLFNFNYRWFLGFFMLLGLVVNVSKVNGQEFLIKDETFTVTKEITQENMGNSFHVWYDMTGYPADWTVPFDYYHGDVYIRYEIISQPQVPGQPGIYRKTRMMFNIWEGSNEGDPETGSNQQLMNGPGSIVESNSSPSSWWLKGSPLDFQNVHDFYKLGLVVWDGESSCLPSTWETGKPNGCTFAANYQDYFFPMQVRMTVVAVAQGASFSGWPKYLTDPQPKFTINYTTEKTNEAISDTIEYSPNNAAPWTLGTNQTISLAPGGAAKSLYFRGKIGHLPIQTLNIPARPSVPNVGLDFYNEITDVKMSPIYEYGGNADLSGFTVIGDGTFPPVTPGQDAYFRYIATPSSFMSSIFHLVIPNRPAKPTYTFSYLNERTNEAIPNSVEYSTNSNMSNATVGNFDFATLVPNGNMYFRVRPTNNSFASDNFVLSLPARPVAPTNDIDFDAEKTTNIVTSSMEYDDNVNFTSPLSGTGVKLDLTPGVNMYIRNKSTVASFASVPKSLLVPNRPLTPAYTIDFVGETTNLVVPSTDEYSSSIDGLGKLVSATSGNGTKISLLPGISPKNLYVRTKPTISSFASAVALLVIPARPAKTLYEVDFASVKTKTALAATDEFSVNSNMIPVVIGTGVALDLTPGTSLYIRKKAVAAVSFASEAQLLDVPVRPATPAYEVDFSAEKTKTAILATDEYSTSLSFTSPINGANLVIDVTPNVNLFFRKKAGVNSFASEIQSLTIPARPTKPTYEIDFVTETTKTAVSSTDEYSTDPAMLSPVASSGADVAGAVVPGNTVYFRTKATNNSFHSDNLILTAPARPSTPSYTIDYIGVTTNENVPSTVEYDTNSSFLSSTSGSGTKAALSPGANLNFRVKATTSTFKSLVYSLTVPNRPAAPNYAIDYITEKTNANVPATVEYAENSNFSGPSLGNGAQIQLIPGTNLYFRVKGTANSFPSNSFLLNVPSRPVAPTFGINFTNETTSAVVDNGIEFSTAPSMSPLSYGTGIALALTPGTDLYLRNKSTNSAFYGLTQHLVVPQRPSITSAEKDTTSITPLNLTVTFPSVVSGFEASDIALSNALLKSIVGNYTVQIAPINVGSVTVNIRANVVSGGNFKADQFKIYYRKGLGIHKSYLLKGVSVFPNPSSGILNIHASDLTGEAVVEITTLEGRVLRLQDLSSNIESIDLSTLPKGIYFVKVKNNGLSSLHKIILQ